MKLKSLLLLIMFILTSLVWVQTASTQAPPSSGSGAQAAPGSRARRAPRKDDEDAQKQDMEAMKADLDKLKAQLGYMKANLAKIKNAEERELRRTNVDMWQVMVDHMEHMMRHLESMGPGMGDNTSGMDPDKMHHHDMGAPPSTPPAEKEPK